MLQYLPNALTFSRLLLAAPLGYLILQQNYQWALAIGLLAGATDALDGFAARRLGALSRFGAILDPIADKLLVATCLVLVAHTDQRYEVALIAVVIIGREITVSALREWMAGLGARAVVKVGMAGKVKTVFQMFGIAFMVYQHRLFGVDVYTLGYYLLLVAAAMTLYSMVVYLKAAWPTIQDHS